jgi:hypothetical protein
MFITPCHIFQWRRVYDEHVRPSYREGTTSYQVPHPDVKSDAAPTDMQPYKPPILVVRADKQYQRAYVHGETQRRMHQ